ncbi:lactate racemase domain-containing protein [Thermogemmatispora carboxidivorans]|uniref:lactate racemase domain-containing protein n=1 Tax=Thermogemmatispora carboxidivorans TaxID=1382306 RepID=UPI000699CA01|nr:lactate racemase domain-containing protein [Thermogemmatispora carboxidivorans]
MLLGEGSTDKTLNSSQVSNLLQRALEPLALAGKRVLIIIPDGTRSAPIPLFFRLLNEQLHGRVAQVDYLIALGTHPPLSEAAITALVGLSMEERAQVYPGLRIFNHQWDRPEMLHVLGTLSAEEVELLTEGLLREEIVVSLNRRILDYDQLIICGPVFPHEVAGFSGGAKYLFPGIAGPDIINTTHWLGALVTSLHTIGIKDTPVRRLLHRAAELVPRPLLVLALVVQGQHLHGLYIGDYQRAFEAAADLSARLNIVTHPHPYQLVLAVAAPLYPDLWTGAKAMYKTEPIVADGGEVIIYAPWISEFSSTHGPLIERVGYHVRDYFLKQPERFRTLPGTIKAHSTHVKGAGSYDATTGREQPRIQVTLATGIDAERCQRVNLGYRDPRTIDPEAWKGREAEGILVVEHAGEVLHRLHHP